MNYVKLGNTGMDVSPICLGAMSFGSAEGWAHNAWALNEEDSRAIVKEPWIWASISSTPPISMPTATAKKFSVGP